MLTDASRQFAHDFKATVTAAASHLKRTGDIDLSNDNTLIRWAHQRDVSYRFV